MNSEQDKDETKIGGDIISDPHLEQSQTEEEYNFGSEYETCLRRLQEIKDSVTFDYDSDADYAPPKIFVNYVTSVAISTSSVEPIAKNEGIKNKDPITVLPSSSAHSDDNDAATTSMAVCVYEGESNNKCPSPIPSFSSTCSGTNTSNLYWADLEEGTNCPMEWCWYKCVRIKWEILIYERLERWLRGEQPGSLDPWEMMEPHVDWWQIVNRCNPSELHEVRREYLEAKYQTALKIMKLDTLWLGVIMRARKVYLTRTTDPIFSELEEQFASSRLFLQGCLDVLLDMQGIEK